MHRYSTAFWFREWDRKQQDKGRHKTANFARTETFHQMEQKPLKYVHTTIKSTSETFICSRITQTHTGFAARVGMHRFYSCCSRLLAPRCKHVLQYSSNTSKIKKLMLKMCLLRTRLRLRLLMCLSGTSVTLTVSRIVVHAVTWKTLDEKAMMRRFCCSLRIVS